MNALDLIQSKLALTVNGNFSIGLPTGGASPTLSIVGAQGTIGVQAAIAVTGDITANNNVNNHTYIYLQNLSNGANAACAMPLFNDTGQVFDHWLTSSGYVGHVIAGDPGVGPFAGLATTGNAPVSFGTLNKERMRIGSTGRIIINAPDSGNALAVSGSNTQYAIVAFGSATVGQSFGLSSVAGTNSSDSALNVVNSAITQTFLNVSGSGAVQFPQVLTTASAANAFLDNTNSNNLLRSTSSIRYKKNVENLDIDTAKKILLGLRPVWYRSNSPADREDWSWYGLIAEEVADLSPQLVHWAKEQIGEKEVEIDNPRWHDGGAELKTLIRMQPVYSDKLLPDAVMYERIVPLMLPFIQHILGESNASSGGHQRETDNRDHGAGTGSDSPGIGRAPAQALGGGGGEVDRGGAEVTS